MAALAIMHLTRPWSQFSHSHHGAARMIYVDWMIGSEKIDIEGLDANGGSTPAFRKGGGPEPWLPRELRQGLGRGPKHRPYRGPKGPRWSWFGTRAGPFL